MRDRIGWHALNLAGAAGDLVSARHSAAESADSLLWRFPLAVAEEAIWDHGGHGSEQAASLFGTSAAIEATTRWGLAGLALPAMRAVAIASARKRARKPFGIEQLYWPAVGAVGGLALAAFQRRRIARALAQHDAELAARETQAFLAGQHSVAMGADSLIDSLEALAPLLGSHEPGSALHEILDAWKSSLAEQASGSASYLGTTVAKWALRHNLHPDLSGYVDASVAEQQGTVLLSAAQAAELAGLLEQAATTGTVTVEVADPDIGGHLPGQQLDVLISGVPFTIHTDRASVPPTFDPGPSALITQVGWFLAAGLPNTEAVPLRWLAAPAGASGLAALWAAREIERRDLAARPAILYLTLALGGVQTVITCTKPRRLWDEQEGKPYSPMTEALQGAVVLLSVYWPRLSPVHRAASLATLAGIWTTGYLLLPGTSSPVAHLRDIVGLASMAWAGGGVTASVELDADDFAEELHSGDQEHIDAAFERGRSMVIDLVVAARDEADGRLADRSASMDERLSAEARRRLAVIDERLPALRGAPELRR